MILGLFKLHLLFFARLQALLGSWLPGLAARAIFASVLLVYFLKSAMAKLGPGVEGLIHPAAGAYAQILPGMMAQVGYDPARIDFLPYGLMVVVAIWAEFLLPILIVIGLFARLASLGMIVFIAAMTYVDIAGHHLARTTIGGFFDRAPDAAIADQRLLWIFPLLYLTIYGAGSFALDRVLARRCWERMQPW